MTSGSTGWRACGPSGGACARPTSSAARRQALDGLRRDLAAIERLETQRAQAAAEQAARPPSGSGSPPRPRPRRQRRERLAALQAEQSGAEREAAAAREERARLEARSPRPTRARAACGRMDRGRAALDRGRPAAEAPGDRGRTRRLAAERARAAAAGEAVTRLRGPIAANPASRERLERSARPTGTAPRRGGTCRGGATGRADARAGSVARIDGRDLDPSRPLQIVEPTELELQPFGRDPPRARRPAIVERGGPQRATRSRRWPRPCGMGVADAAAAEALLEQRGRLEAELREQLASSKAVLDGRGCSDLADSTRCWPRSAGGASCWATAMRWPMSTTSRPRWPRLGERRAELQASREQAKGETEALARRSREANAACARQDGSVAELSRQSRRQPHSSRPRPPRWPTRCWPAG